MEGQPQPPSYRTKHAPRVLGRYVLHGELASGGMATVHLARLVGEAGFTRTVAIKRLHPQFAKDPDFVAMFTDEARLAARIRHPNVVPTLDVVSEQGEMFLVLEYVHGESLSKLLRALQLTKGRVPPGIAVTVVAQVLHGLHAAHEAKSEKGAPLEIVHRDVSPQNILVGVDGMAHVVDFGVAKARGRVQTTREGQLKGKVSYMAPEQLDGRELTRQSDVYAAAVVLWETLCLRRLFEGDNDATVLVRVLEAKVAPPSKYVSDPSYPPALDAIVMKGLAKDPADRWATAREFALALEKSMALAPASAVGEWVQSIAAEELGRRARKLADIERGSIRLPAASSEPPVREAAIGESEGAIRVAPPEPRSQVSTISVTRSEHAGMTPLPPPRKRRWGAGLAIATALAVAVLVVAVLRRGPRPPTAYAPPTAAAPLTAPVTPPPPLPATAPPTDLPTLTTQPVTISDAPGDSASPPPAASAPPPPARKKHSNDCDPPFTRDAQGHKHYKLQCL